jgi:hypothetical protein
LGGFERHRGFPPALRAGGHGFRLGKTAAATLALGLAGLAPLGFVFEVFVMEEVLFSRRKYKIRSAVYTLKNSVLKLRHNLCPVAYQYWWLGRRDQSPAVGLLDLPAILLPVAFASQRLLGPQLLARLQVKRVSFHLFNNVLLLDLTLEASEGVLQSFALLKLYFSQTKNTSLLDRKIPVLPFRKDL